MSPFSHWTPENTVRALWRESPGSRREILKNNIWSCRVSGELLYAAFSTVVTVTFLAGPDPLRPCSIWEQVVKIPSAALSSPLRVHAVPSLRPFRFLLIAPALIYDRTRGNSFQVLIRISPRAVPQRCRLFYSPPDFSLSLSVLWSVLRSSSSISEQKHTLISISLLSPEYTTKNTWKNYIPPPAPLWLKGMYASAIPEFSLSRPYREEKVNPILSVLKGALRGRKITPNSSHMHIYLQYAQYRGSIHIQRPVLTIWH